MEITSHKPGRSPLYHLQVVYVGGRMWVPYYAGKLHLGSNQGFVAQYLGLLWALVDVSVEESSGVVSFPCHLVYVMIPVKLVVDVDPEVLC